MCHAFRVTLFLTQQTSTTLSLPLIHLLFLFYFYFFYSNIDFFLGVRDSHLTALKLLLRTQFIEIQLDLYVYDIMVISSSMVALVPGVVLHRCTSLGNKNMLRNSGIRVFAS